MNKKVQGASLVVDANIGQAWALHETWRELEERREKDVNGE